MGDATRDMTEQRQNARRQPASCSRHEINAAIADLLPLFNEGPVLPKTQVFRVDAARIHVIRRIHGCGRRSQRDLGILPPSNHVARGRESGL